MNLREYYESQAGSGLNPSYVSYRYLPGQRGNGLFGTIIKSGLMPLIRSIFPYVKNTAIEGVGEMISGLKEGKSVKEVAKSTARKTAGKVLGDMASKLQSGSGVRRRRHKTRIITSKRRKTVKRKTRKSTRRKSRRTRKCVSLNMETRIHPASQIVCLPALNLWDVCPTQTSVWDTVEHGIRPIATFSASTPLRFEVLSAKNEYLIFEETLLNIKLKITLTSTSKVEANDWKNVKLAPNLLHSLFSSVSMEIAGKRITMAPSLYAFKSWFENFLNYSDKAKKTHMISFGWAIDELEKRVQADKPDELILDLWGWLNLDLQLQDKWLMGGTDFVLELIPNPMNFYCNVTEGSGKGVKVDFADAAMYVTKALVSPDLESAHESAIAKAPARYPFSRNEVKHFTLSQGKDDIILDNVCTGLLPRRLHFVLLNASDFATNPFNFKHFQLSHYCSYRDGIAVPRKPHTPNFTKGIVMREYLAFFRANNYLNNDPKLGLTIDQWKEKPIFTINFSQDLSNGLSQGVYCGEKRIGHLRLHLKFEKPLTEALVVLLFLEFDSVLEIDFLRNVHVTY